MLNTKINLSEEIISSAERIIKRYVEENPDVNPLRVAQQVNYASLLLHTAGNHVEEEYKQTHKAKFNDLH